MDSIESITGKLIAKYDSLEFKSIKNVFTGNSVLYGKLNPYLRKYYKPNFTGVCSSEFWVLNPIKITQSFLYHFVTTDNFNIQTNKTCGTSMPRADWDVIKGSNIYYPTNEEQVKIGSFLDMIDSKIRIVDSKISTLKKYKKGMINQLLNNIKFSNRELLSNLCKITTGKLDANAMNQNGKYKFFTCSREDYLIDTYAFDCEALLISGNGEVGLTKYYKGKFNAYQRTYVLYDFEKSAKFIKTCVDVQIDTVIRRETNKGAMPYIRLSTFNKILIPLVSKKDEINIENTIDIIDKKIEFHENTLRTLQMIKKQLLNSMFI
ncbi:Type I restriction modification DNA specificity domain [Chlamydia trachomatis]|nr:Type I restriction modification DNA specificity domain [Chlamydia trachomatis]CRH54924.1 Type I restriction modification DNA specificity domain [Chlamydia trachomatis]